MTKQQRLQLGGVSDRGLRLLIDVRRFERENEGVGIKPAVLLAGRPVAYWITLQNLQRLGLCKLRDDLIVTRGRARAIGPSWWGRSAISK